MPPPVSQILQKGDADLFLLHPLVFCSICNITPAFCIVKVIPEVFLLTVFLFFAYYPYYIGKNVFVSYNRISIFQSEGFSS